MRQKIVVVLSCLVLVGSLVSLWLRFRSPTLKLERTMIANTNTGLGEALAEETIKAMQDRGNVVLVTMLDPVPRRQILDERWKAFDRVLKQHPSIQVANDTVPFVREPGREFIPQDAFSALLQKHADADAMVFLVELPEWVAVADAIPRDHGPKLIAVDVLGQLTRVHYGGYFDNGILVALIGKRLEPAPASAAPPRTTREWFDQQYQIYTPANFQSLFGGGSPRRMPGP